jgi:hypothetical protein
MILHRSLLLATSASLATALACSQTGGSAPPEAAPAEATPASQEAVPTAADDQPPTPPGNGQSRDDALADQGAWTLGGYDLERYGPIGEIQFADGQVVLTSDQDYAWAWAVYADIYAGVILTVDVTKISESDASPGMICNYRSEQDFYYATVGSFGVYTVNHYTDGLYETVLEGGSSTSGPILPDGQTNRLELTCADDQIRLSVNGEALGSAPAPTGGQVGLMLETFSHAVSAARFANLRIKIP